MNIQMINLFSDYKINFNNNKEKFKFQLKKPKENIKNIININSGYSK